MSAFARGSQRTRAGQSGPLTQLRPARETAAIIRLQRSLGNRTTRALLRSPHENDPEFAAVAGVFPKGGMDAATWREKVTAAKQAVREHRLDDATSLYVELYQDLARTAGAEAVADVSPKYPINIAKADDTEYKAGLNLVLGSGGSRGGSTAYIDASGKFGARLSLAGGSSQGVAIRLFGGSFSEDKAMTLDVLRHEMAHAKHLIAARESVAKWAGAGGKGGSDKFESWLKRNRKGLSDSQVALFSEQARGGSANTEVLAYVEGFMTVFHLIDPPPPVDHPIFVELLGVLETTKVLPWRSADKAVRDVAIARLEHYYCDTMDSDHRRAFDAWVQTQSKRADDDEAVLKAKSNGGAAASARARQENAFTDFIKRLKAMLGKCAAKPIAKAGR